MKTTRRKFIRRSGAASVGTMAGVNILTSRDLLAQGDDSSELTVSSVITGYKLNGTTKIPIAVTATITAPGADHAELHQIKNTLAIEGSAYATLGTPTVNGLLYTITVPVLGHTPSTAASSTRLAATRNGTKKNGTVTVVIPDSFGTLPDATGDALSPGPERRGLGPGTSPAATHRPFVLPNNGGTHWFPIPAGMWCRCYLTSHDIDYPVLDQFGNALSTIYDGSAVDENIAGGGFDAISTITAGSFTDPVGDTRYHYVPTQAPYQWKGSMSNGAIPGWENLPNPLPPAANVIPNDQPAEVLTYRVAGHAIGGFTREVDFHANNTVDIDHSNPTNP